MNKISGIMRDSAIRHSPSENDTIRLWESHKEQALIWRALCLLQVPVTFVAIIAALVMFFNRRPIINVPERPLPGLYSADEIPAVEFENYASEYLNLVATYQPTVARRQFQAAKDMLWGEIIQTYETEMMETELKMIENTKRTQIFFKDPTATKVVRDGRNVVVTLVGDRQKIQAGKEINALRSEYTVVMTTVPKNKFNPYGIVIINVSLKNLEDR
jgi:hypothetical protein